MAGTRESLGRNDCED